eukprot:scaffold27240_cov64-Phaeocystis_antarctica.AAC.3
MGWLLASRENEVRADGCQARLHSLTKNGPVLALLALLAALAAHLRRLLIEVAADTVRGRGGRIAAPGRK